MSYDVLVVDDDSQAGQEYARLIRESTKLQVVFTDDPAKAIEMVRSEAVKVAVLDQRMGGVLGTQVFSSMHEADQRLRAIMFTGLADTAEVGDAFTKGYAAYLHKADVGQLSERVMGLYLAYQTESASLALSKAPPTILTRKHGFPRRRQTVYNLLSVELIDDEWVDPISWTTAVSIQAGETQEYVSSVSRSTTISLEQETQQRLASDFGLKAEEILNLTLAIKSEVSDRIKTSATTQANTSLSQKRTYHLPDEPSNPDELHVKSRRIERAPVNRRLRLNVGVGCQCCNLQNIFSILVVVETGGVATRHVDTLSNGEQREVNTGVERW